MLTDPTFYVERKATVWLNYPSRVIPDRHKPLGPNLLGERLWPVEVEHDKPKPGWTRVGFSLIAPLDHPKPTMTGDARPFVKGLDELMDRLAGKAVER